MQFTHKKPPAIIRNFIEQLEEISLLVIFLTHFTCRFLGSNWWSFLFFNQLLLPKDRDCLKHPLEPFVPWWWCMLFTDLIEFEGLSYAFGIHHHCILPLCVPQGNVYTIPLWIRIQCLTFFFKYWINNQDLFWVFIFIF